MFFKQLIDAYDEIAKLKEQNKNLEILLEMDDQQISILQEENKKLREELSKYTHLQNGWF